MSLVPFTIGTNGGIESYRKLPKNANDTITVINAISTSDGTLYTQLFKAATNIESGNPNIQQLTADNPVRYRMIGDNMGFISFNFVMSASADASLSISFGDQNTNTSDAVTLYDSEGKGLKSTNGALNVVIGDAAINVDISVEDNIVVYGKTDDDEPVPLKVNDSGNLLISPIVQSTSSLQSVYEDIVNINNGVPTNNIDIGQNGRHVNILGRSTVPCLLKMQYSSDAVSYYNSIYSIIVYDSQTFNISLPSQYRYIRLVPDKDISLSLQYTFI